MLVSGATSAAVVATALHAGIDGVLVGVLAVGTLASVEVTLALVGAARQWTQLRAGLRRVAPMLTEEIADGSAAGAVDPAAPEPPRLRDRRGDRAVPDRGAGRARPGEPRPAGRAAGGRGGAERGGQEHADRRTDRCRGAGPGPGHAGRSGAVRLPGRAPAPTGRRAARRGVRVPRVGPGEPAARAGRRERRRVGRRDRCRRPARLGTAAAGRLGHPGGRGRRSALRRPAAAAGARPRPARPATGAGARRAHRGTRSGRRRPGARRRDRRDPGRPCRTAGHPPAARPGPVRRDPGARQRPGAATRPARGPGRPARLVPGAVAAPSRRRSGYLALTAR